MRASIPVEAHVDGMVAAAVASEFARRIGLTRAQEQRIALTAGEIATNVRKHGGGGRVEIRFDGDDVEVWGFDRGPGLRLDGIASVRDASRGWGLEAIARAMDTVQSGREPGGDTWVKCTLHVGGGRP